eukprot:NODE_216_length_12483_cov_2.137516.p10 type:complete len:104 gc:universal NODE_216_length_12483_cov_2.137516:1710-2021(+)
MGVLHLGENEQKVYESVIEAVIEDLVHSIVKEKRRKCSKCGTPCHLHQFKLASGGNERFSCPSCYRTFVSTRFAQHLEKCLGLAASKPRKKKDSQSPSKSTTA